MDLKILRRKVSTAFMYPGGASFETHVAVIKNNQVFKFIPSLQYALYMLMYMFFSIG